MPQALFEYDDTERSLLERIRIQQGLQDCDQAAEWLIKARLRRAALRLTGRGRALYPVGRNEQ
ncbi:MAG: hypothetical protein V7756_04610 [Halopseudomonas sp.]|uniref:hypothetical protein n=1 Tax=Halopseudomonas sp. TaxID=2901191 RepID=UPI0030013BB5